MDEPDPEENQHLYWIFISAGWGYGVFQAVYQTCIIHEMDSFKLAASNLLNTGLWVYNL